MRFVLSILAGLFFTVFVIIVVSFIISFVYEDEVSAIFLKELNTRVEEDIRAEEVNLSLLKKFPSAVVELQSFELHSLSEESHEKNGSFSFSAEEVNFQFDVIDLFKGKYTLENIYFNQCQLNIISGAGRRQMNFKKKSSDKVTLDINKLVFNDLYYSIGNTDQSFSLKGKAPETVLRGNVSLEKFDLQVDSKLFVDSLIVDRFPYIQRKDLRLSFNLSVTPERYEVKTGNIYYEELPFTTEGFFNREKRVLDLSLRGNSLDVESTRLYLPWEIKKKMEVLPVKGGKLDFYARLNGPVKDGRPEFQADFSLNQGEILLKHRKPLRLENVSVTGYLSNGRFNSPVSSVLTLNNLHAEWNGNELNCNVNLSDFKQPHLAIEGSADLNFGKLSEYLTHPALENSRGRVYLNYELDEDMKDLDNLEHLIRSRRLTVDATFENATLNNDRFNVALGSGFAYLDRNLYLDSLQLSLNGNEMLVNGRFNGIYENIGDSLKPYRFDLTVESPGINMNRLLANSPKSRDSLVNFQFPHKMSGNIDFHTGWFEWNDFNASEMSGRISFSDRLIQMNQLEIDAFQGMTYANATLKDTGKDSAYLLDSRLYLDHINIHKVFSVFHDFGQQYITHQNLNGYLSGDVKLKSNLNNHLKINKNSLFIFSDIIISNGKLVDFEPLIQLANFTSLSELKHVSFSRLSNEITIEDRTIYIPEMDISSSAFDITVSGYHTFENTFSYQVNLLLSQVISKKARQNDDLETEFGIIQEDGVGRSKIFLKIHGTPEKYAIQYDKEGLKNNIRKNLQQEKNELKSILNEEFGWFERDSILHSEESRSEAKRFNINWEADDSVRVKESEKTVTSGSPKEERGEFIIQWEDDTLK